MTNIYFCAGGSAAAVNNSTLYHSVASADLVGDATEANIQTTWENAGTFSNLTCHTYTAPVNSPTVVYRVGGGSGNQTVTIVATGDVTDTTHTDLASAGDKINYKANSPSNGNFGYNVLGIQFAPTTTGNCVNKLSSYGPITDTSVNTSYYNPLVCANARGANPETDFQFKNKTAATLKNLFTYVSANTLSVATVKSEVAAATNGNLVCSIGSGATGAIEDTTHTDSIVSGTLINTVLKSTVTTSFTITTIAVDYLTTTAITHYINGGQSPNLNSGNINYFTLAGDGSVKTNTESRVQSASGVAFTASNLETYLITNTLTGTSNTVSFRLGAADGNEIITLTASTAGYYEDTTHNDSVLVTSLINYKFNSVAGTTAAFGTIGILGTYPAGVNTITETVTETDSYASYNLRLLTETVTETDSEVAKATSTALTLTETQTESDSYLSYDIRLLTETVTESDSYASYNLRTLTESVTESDSSTILAIDSGLLTETITETDTATIIATDSGLLTETVTETDSEVAKATSTALTLTETQTESDSYLGLEYYVNTVSETITGSDSYVILTVDLGLTTETATVSDVEAGAATGVTNLNETGIVSDSHLGIASALLTLSESQIESDSYDSGLNVITETITETDSATILATDSDVDVETVAANDNYVCQQTIISTGVAQTGPSDGDELKRKRHLEWLKKQKQRRAELLLEKNKNRYVTTATSLPEIVIDDTAIRQEVAIKSAAISSILGMSEAYQRENLQKLAYNELLDILNDTINEDDAEMILLLA